MESLLTHAKGFGSLFYAVNPYETMYEKEEDIPEPDMTTQAIPYFFLLLFVENTVLVWKGKRSIRWNDGITSGSTGMMMMVKDVVFKGFLMETYVLIHDRYRLLDLRWDSLTTWIMAALATDFAYYWGHRAAHELNILWAGHQVHHSSEELNLTTALRQSVAQSFGTMPMYLPAALFIPPTHILIHIQLNTLYQFWIHTELIRSLGPLEHVLNTAKHHRVHHGSNRYCLDKNYGGLLIVWDRIFGTFAWEREDEEIVFGLVDQPQFFNPLKHQVFYYVKVWEKACSMTNWKDRLFAFVKGPGWFPGTPRLGDNAAVPEIQLRPKYNPRVPKWAKVYCAVHFVLVLTVFLDLSNRINDMDNVSVISTISFIFWTLTSMGMILDKSPLVGPISEIVRCGIFLLGINLFGVLADFGSYFPIFNAAYGLSVLAAVRMFTVLGLTEKDPKKKST